MSTNIAAAIKAAQERAAQAPVQQAAPAANANLPAAPAAIGLPAAPGQRMTLDDVAAAGSMQVDGFFKVKETYLLIDNEAGMIASTQVLIRLSEVQACQVIKYGKNPTIYEKTYDGVRNAKGGSWAESCQRARMADPQASPYTSADIPMVLVDDVKDMMGKPVKGGEKGKRLGYGLSTTNLANFQQLMRDAEARGFAREDLLLVEVGVENRKKGGYSWGVMTFKLLDRVDEGSPE